MKRSILLLTGILYSLLFLGSCSVEQEISNNSTMQLNREALLTFNNQNDLLEAISTTNDSNTHNKPTRSLSTGDIPTDFISLLDPVRDNDPVLDKMSTEEREAVKKEKATYYEVLGYEDLIPNRNLARLFNTRGELQVGDTIIRITPWGTISTNIKYRQEMDSISASLVNKNIVFPYKYSKIKLSENVSLINTFHLNEVQFERGSALATRTKAEDIPTTGFRFFYSKSSTIAGKVIASVFGDRSVKEHDFKKGYRVCGSLYDYNYGVYYEIGSFVSMEQKRGGFFKWMNGWREIKAEELSLQYHGIVLELKINTPDQPGIPKNNFYFGPSTAKIPGLDKDVVFAEIFGHDIKESDIIKLAGTGLKEGLKYLSSKLGSKVSNVTAARIVTPNKAYIVIWDEQLNAYNQKCLRKVFSSGVQFFITVNLLDLASSLKSMYRNFYHDLNNAGVSRLVAGEVHLAGKHGGQWGGMTIQKKQ